MPRPSRVCGSGELTGEEQAALLRELARAESRVSGLRLKVLAAAEKADTARRAGAASTGQWAAQLSRSDSGQTQRRRFHHQRIHDTGFLHRYLADGAVRCSRRT